MKGGDESKIEWYKRHQKIDVNVRIIDEPVIDIFAASVGNSLDHGSCG